MSLKLVSSTCLGAVAVVALSAAPQQAPPATEIYLMAMAGAQKPDLERWANISNNAGYDNQPSFLPDSSGLLFSSMRDGKQTDIYRYDIASERVTQATNTPESEYSPTVTPDKRGFSAVRVEADNAQRLWRFNLDGSNPRVVLQDVKPVGYHVWIDETHLALFVLGANGGPATLQLADTTTGAATVAVTGIGRSLLMRPGTSTVSYLATGETPPMLKALEPRTGVSTALIAPVAGSQDCAWLPDGRLLMARGRAISAWAPGTTTWEAFVEFPTAASGPTPPGAVGARPGFDAITRLAVSPDGKWLAFVANPRQP